MKEEKLKSFSRRKEMKKIIAAAAGLMIAGTAMAASAAIEFSGDARARYYFQDNYSLGAIADDQEDHWSNRVRLKVKGTTAGGSYAVVRVRANNGNWGDADAAGEGSDVVYDHAYVGTDFGCINVEAGRMDYGITTGFWNDANLDQLKAKYSMDDTTIVATYAVTNNEVALDNQSEDRVITLGWIQGWGEWNTTLAAAVVNNDTKFYAGEDSTGMMANIAVAGPAGPVAFAAEFGWQEDGFVATDEITQGSVFTGDDGFGGYLTAGMDFDALNVTFATGFAVDGFAWDLPVGFTMLGGDKIITPAAFKSLGNVNGAAADTYWAGFITGYQVSEQLGLTFDLAYANVEPVDTDLDHDAFEVAGRASYAVNDGTMLHFEAGYLTVDGDIIDDDAFGAALSLELSF